LISGVSGHHNLILLLLPSPSFCGSISLFSTCK
jgi:hypothetical protein